MDFFQLFWVFFLLISFIPMWRQQRIHRLRLSSIHKIEKLRGTRVITLIHRQEALSFLGLPFRRFINIEDSEAVLRAIRYTPPQMPIDIILHTPGGLVLAAEQIARAIKKHPGKVTAFVPHYAMSGGTLIALAADEIHLDENAVLGPIDPQLGNYPAASILKAVEQKPVKDIEDQTLILADMARKALAQVEAVVYQTISDRMAAEAARDVAKALTQGRWTHDYPLTCDQLSQLGLTIQCGLPREIYALMELYPQPAQRRPSVQYVPLPYDPEAEES
ncbi:MAG: hypothetical protein GX998_06645 [Firmicutes bacterium]|nr:hypothetical protein [Bacillota bacterium]